MEILKKKLGSNKAPYHYLAYCLSFITYGGIITGIGPLVPYLSAITGHVETQYSIIFVCRAMGFMIGAISLRYVQKIFNFHQILMISSFLIFVLSFIFSFVLNMMSQGFIFFLISVSSCYLEVIINLCFLQTQKNGEVQFWMLIGHGMFGIGGFIGPVIVYIFEQYSYLFMGVFILSVSPFYYFLKTPEDHQKVIQKVQQQTLVEQIKNAGHQGSVIPIQNQEVKVQKKIISKKLELIISLMFFLYVGIQVCFGGWISSYVVLQQIATKQQATSYSSVFWVYLTLWRFIIPFINMKPMQKLFLLLQGTLLSTLIAILLILKQEKSLASMFLAIALGGCLSSIFPLLLSIPSQYKLEITSAQTSNCIIWASLGEGTLSTLMGYLMQYFGNDMFFYTLFVFAISILITAYVMKKVYLEQSQLNQSQIQMKQIQAQKKLNNM